MKLKFTNKAKTLQQLADKVNHSVVLPQFCFSVSQWSLHAPDLVALASVDLPEWMNGAVIVRSSAASEDSEEESLAGHFMTVANVKGTDSIIRAINEVVTSFPDTEENNLVFIQPYLADVAASGVAFTRDPSNGSHYYVINYDDKTGETDTVTSGSTNNLRTHHCAKFYKVKNSPRWMRALIDQLKELEELYGRDALDIEFAVDGEEVLYLLQARPLIIKVDSELEPAAHEEVVRNISEKVKILSGPHPYLCGKRSIFGVMPDWNPAEIIGVRPRPLALSLYKELITDGTWAFQRGNYGYRNLRSFPLLVSFGGCPYIDVRVSFNSFIPKDIEDELAERLVEHYIQQLIDMPSHHDKVEFEVIYSCYTFDLPERIKRLQKYGFSKEDCETLTAALRRLTKNIISNNTGLWAIDAQKLDELKKRQNTILGGNLPILEKIYWLLEDCKRYGTLPFAGLARAGFIAVQMLKSLVSEGILSDNEYDGFMGSLNSVGSSLVSDFASLSKDDFLEQYGHLRPGTYDILSPRYDEEPDLYFDWDNPREKTETKKEAFGFSLEILNKISSLLQLHEIENDPISLFNFIKGAIEGREYAKFVFTKSLSESLHLLREFGQLHGYTVDEMSFLDISVIRKLYASTEDPLEVIRKSITDGQASYKVTCALNLPPLVINPDEVFSFEYPESQVNYITQKVTVSKVVSIDEGRDQLAGNIVMMPSADPGFDWIFSTNISGFITMYGGVNSHMAIRAAELGIPAAIGVGEIMYERLESVELLELDCGNRQVRTLR
jgi:glutamine kinase